ncbi:MAG: nucleotidyl transferase AbiEii/AbiGii toxin family protein [bacterium]
MLSLTQIQSYYPTNLQQFSKGLLREYLQYKILDLIFGHKYGSKLSFIGGTALRIIHGNSRFSEDLDFDNFGLQAEEFEDITVAVKKGLELEGFVVEMQNVYKGAYHCKIRIPKILFENNLASMEAEKFLILIDTVGHYFEYIPEKIIINKFDVFTTINVTPLSLLLSQKIFAVFCRNRAKGRDFFDLIFLFGKNIEPNYDYLKVKIGLDNKTELKQKLLEKCLTLDFVQLNQDVQPFLFNPNDTRVEKFVEYFKVLQV